MSVASDGAAEEDAGAAVAAASRHPGGQEPPRLSRSWPAVGHLLELRRDPLALMQRVRSECGEIGHFRLAGHDITLLSGAEQRLFCLRVRGRDKYDLPARRRVRRWANLAGQ